MDANHASNPVTSANIKAYVSANAGGSGDGNVVLYGINAVYQVPEGFDGCISWGRSEWWHTGGSQITITLPSANTTGMSFDIQILNGHGTPQGQFFLNIPSGSSDIWDSYTWLKNPEIFGMYPSNSTKNLLVQNLGTSRWGVNCITSGGYNYWYCYPKNNLVQQKTNVLNIAANTAAIADQHFFKFFANDEANYAPLNQAGNHYTIPDGHMHVQLVYGDGLEQVKANCSGIWVNLPENPADGCVIKHCSLHNYNSTSSSDVICINFSQTGNQPVGRKLVDDHTLYTRGGTETALVEGHATSTSSGRKESVFFYIQSEDMWVHRLASY